MCGCPGNELDCEIGSMEARSATYIESKKSAIAQVNTFESANVVLTIPGLLHDPTTIGSKSMNASVSNAGTLDETNTLKLGEVGQLSDALVGEIATAGEIDVPNASARLCQGDDGCVGDAGAVA